MLILLQFLFSLIAGTLGSIVGLLAVHIVDNKPINSIGSLLKEAIPYGVVIVVVSMFLL